MGALLKHLLEPDAIIREVLAIHRDFDGRVASLSEAGNLRGGGGGGGSGT